MKLSIFRIQRDGHKSVQNVEVGQFMERLQSLAGNEEVMQYREFAPSMDDPTQWVRYKKLPEVCPTSEYRRNGSQEPVWACYNGISVLKITGLSSVSEIRKAKNFVKRYPQVFCAFTGADGHSLVVWTIAMRSDGQLPSQQDEALSFCAEAYAMSVRCLSPDCEFDLQVEEPSLHMSCPMSYDPEPYLNNHPAPFIIEPSLLCDVSKLEANRQVSSYLTRLKPGAESFITLTTVFDGIYHRVRDGITGWRPANDPLRMVALVADACAQVGMPEEEVSHRLFALFAQSLNEDEVRGFVRNVYSNYETLPYTATLRKHQLVAYRLREFLARRYDIRFNEVLQMTEFRERQSLAFLYRELTRRELNTIHHEALIEGIEASFGEVEQLVHSTRVPLYNPIVDYLNKLPAWDGQDHIAQVADLVPNANPHWQRLFRQWFLSMVAHWMNADTTHANATAPILIGKQGYRKSTFCRMLLPPELQAFFTDSVDFRSNTEAERYLSRFLLVNIDEFDQLTEKQFAFVKHLFQKPRVNLRRMYSEAIGTQRRYASFIGTSNYQEVLRDPTGNRRYICVEVTDPIRVEQGINHAQLYAQACRLINCGERYWLNDEDEALLKESNRVFEVESQQEQIFRSLFDTQVQGDDALWLRTTEILEIMSQHPLFNKRGDISLAKLGKVLTKLNVPKKRGADGYKYRVGRMVEADKK